MLTLMPSLLALLGAGVLWILPAGGIIPRLRRWAHIAILLSVAVLLLMARAQGALSSELPYWRSLFSIGEVLLWRADRLSTAFALLLSGTLAVVSLSMFDRTMERYEVVISLLVAGSGVGVCLAGNLVTLCLFWLLTDLALLLRGATRAPEESEPHVMRQTVLNLLSTTALIMATVLLMVDQGDVPLERLQLTGLPLLLLVGAALLRLGLYPLPGSLKRRWETFLVALCCGGYLWLRIANQAPQGLPELPWLVSLCVVVMVLTGLLASLSPNYATAVPYILMHGISALVLAPLLDAIQGFPIAYLLALNLVLSLAVLRVDVQVRPVRPLGWRARLPLLVSMASSLGAPLTVGFTARWALLKLCWASEQRLLLLWITLAAALLAVPAWQRLSQVFHEVRENSAEPPWGVWVAIGGSAGFSIVMVLLGLDPLLFGRAWPGLANAPLMPTLREVLRADWGLAALLVLATVVVPLPASYLLQRLRARLSERLARPFDTVSILLEWDWAYVGLERALLRGQELFEQALGQTGEAFFLGWTLLWGLVTVLLLAGS
jgi:hypothetical protein